MLIFPMEIIKQYYQIPKRSRNGIKRPRGEVKRFWENGLKENINWNTNKHTTNNEKNGREVIYFFLEYGTIKATTKQAKVKKKDFSL